MTLLLPRLRQDQTTIVKAPHKIKCVAMGRRWGKTTMAGALALSTAAHGGIIAWVAPTFTNSRPLWRFIEKTVVSEPQAKILRWDHTVSFPSGGRISVYSADNDISIRGESFDLIIVDEAARVKEGTFSDVLLPTLADRDGKIVLISTPKGKNWFYRQYVLGLQGHDHSISFTAPSSDNPMPTIKRATELAKQTVSNRTYRQEWMAEFVEDGAGVFRGVLDCVREYNPNPEPLKTYCMGVDWGRTGDATVFTVICIEDRQVVEIESMNDTAYALQVDRLRRLFLKWQPYVILAESNSMGGPLIEALQRLELPVQAFATTAISKPILIDALALAIERGDIGLINDTKLLSELETYESERMSTGLIRYSAPAGMHDDYVISLSLAWKVASKGGPLILFEV